MLLQAVGLPKGGPQERSRSVEVQSFQPPSISISAFHCNDTSSLTAITSRYPPKPQLIRTIRRYTPPVRSSAGPGSSCPVPATRTTTHRYNLLSTTPPPPLSPSALRCKRRARTPASSSFSSSISPRHDLNILVLPPRASKPWTELSPCPSRSWIPLRPGCSSACARSPGIHGTRARTSITRAMIIGE